MKKIFFIVSLVAAVAFFSTCDRNEIYFYSDNPVESALLFEFFNNIAKSGNSGTPPSRIYIYNAGQYDGALGGRAGADALCAAGAPIGTTTHHAFLSVSATDQVRNLLPAAFRSLPIPVMDSSGANIISNGWNGLWDGSINITLQSASILPGGSQWWSGSYSNGTFRPTSADSSNSCGYWTQNTGLGQIGASIYDATPVGAWIDIGTQGCTASCYVLCMAY